MADLTVRGLSDDGTSLHLADSDGKSYTVILDGGLSALLQTPSHAKPREIALDTLSPKEIQARIRSGATPEELAEESGLPLDRIERFSGPPLAERSWTSEQARSTLVRRDAGDATLDDIVIEYAVKEGFDSSSITWDSWRRDDGRWSVVVGYPEDGAHRSATWAFDPRTRSLHPDDDSARRLVSDDKVVALRPAGQKTVVVARTVEVVTESHVEETMIDVLPIEAKAIGVSDEDLADESADVVPVKRASRSTSAQEPAVDTKGKKGRRASVPSWDEILFGASQTDS